MSMDVNKGTSVRLNASQCTLSEILMILMFNCVLYHNNVNNVNVKQSSVYSASVDVYGCPWMLIKVPQCVSIVLECDSMRLNSCIDDSMCFFK